MIVSELLALLSANVASGKLFPTSEIIVLPPLDGAKAGFQVSAAECACGNLQLKTVAPERAAVGDPLTVAQVDSFPAPEETAAPAEIAHPDTSAANAELEAARAVLTDEPAK